MGQATQTNTYSGGRKVTINIWQRLEADSLSTVQADGFFTFLDFPVNLANIGDLVDVSGPDYVARLKLSGKNSDGWITQTLSPTGGTFRADTTNFPLIHGSNEPFAATNIHSVDNGASIGSYDNMGAFTVNKSGRYHAIIEGRLNFDDMAMTEATFSQYSIVASIWLNGSYYEGIGPVVPIGTSNSTLGTTTVNIVAPFYASTMFYLEPGDAVLFTLRPGTLPGNSAAAYSADGSIYLTKIADI